MGQDVKIEFREDHIHVVLGPDYKITPEQSDDFWQVLRETAGQHDSRRVLIEGAIPEGPQTPGEVIQEGKRTAQVPGLWMAVCLEGYIPNERSELFEVIAASQGVRVKFFSDTEHALSWLRSNTSK